MSQDFSGTRPVNEKHAFDIARLAAWMRTHVAGFDDSEKTLVVEQFKGGQSNPTFLLEAGGRRYVLRRKPGSFFERQIARWTKQYRAAETEKIAAMDALIDWLPQHIPADESSAIVHGDFRLDNLIFHASEPRIIAVLDWELSTLGHPMADFAYHCLAWHMPPGKIRGLLGYDLATLGIPQEADHVARYCQRTGRAPVAVEWNYYLAFNLFRLCAIAQGIAARALQGNAASAEAVDMGKLARPVAEAGWRLARQY